MYHEGNNDQLLPDGLSGGTRDCWSFSTSQPFCLFVGGAVAQCKRSQSFQSIHLLFQFDRLQLLQWGWCLCYTDRLHCGSCVFVFAPTAPLPWEECIVCAATATCCSTFYQAEFVSLSLQFSLGPGSPGPVELLPENCPVNVPVISKTVAHGFSKYT